MEERRDLKVEMMNLRVQRASGQLENPARIKIVRKTIARIETIIVREAKSIKIQLNQNKHRHIQNLKYE